MSDLPKTQLPLTGCVRGYQDEPGAPAILPTACRLRCPIVRGKKVRETWLNAQDCAGRLGYRSAGTFTGAWRRGRIFRNILRREGTHHRATGFPLCGLSAYKRWRIDTASEAGPVPPFAHARAKGERRKKEARQEAGDRARQEAVVHRQEAFDRMSKIKAEMSSSSTRQIVECLLQNREGLSDADIARIVGVTKQRVWAIKHGLNR